MEREVSNQEILEFITNEDNRDFLEQAQLYSEKLYGWRTLSSGKTVYISTPLVSGAEAKSMLSKMESIIE